jgi:hypothetical protein
VRKIGYSSGKSSSTLSARAGEGIKTVRLLTSDRPGGRCRDLSCRRSTAAACYRASQPADSAQAAPTAPAPLPGPSRFSEQGSPNWWRSGHDHVDHIMIEHRWAEGRHARTRATVSCLKTAVPASAARAGRRRRSR